MLELLGIFRGKLQIEHSFKGGGEMTAEQIAALLAAVDRVVAASNQILASNAALKAQLAAVPAPVDTTPLVNVAGTLDNLANQLAANV